MKKIVAVAVAVIAAVVLVNRARSSKADKDLWAEATDTV
ncbi:MAG TPA: DLW-39 family protein [Nocardioidaceae bacterium]|nr:DLW-39 family protein [Nocardioidaceae bacterium]